MRVAVFIDGGYLLKQLQDAKIAPDYPRLVDYLLAPLRRQTQLDLMRCYFYYCPPWMSERPTEDELRRMATHEKFVLDIQETCDRWQIRLGKLERRRDGDKEVFAQKRVDVQLSVDLVQHAAAGHIQHAVVVAGDSDFIPAIVAAKASGATLTLWCDQDRSVHRELVFHADEVHFFDWRSFPVRRPKPTRAAPPALKAEPLVATPAAPDSAVAKSVRAQPTRPPRRQTRAPGALPGGVSNVANTNPPPDLPPSSAPNSPPADAQAKPARRRRRGGRGRKRPGGGAPPAAT